MKQEVWYLVIKSRAEYWKEILPKWTQKTGKLWAFAFIDNEDRKEIVRKYNDLRDELLGLLAVIQVYESEPIGEEIITLKEVLELIQKWNKTLGKEVKLALQNHPRIEKIERIDLVVSNAVKLLKYYKEGRIKNLPTNKTLQLYLEYSQQRAEKIIKGQITQERITLLQYVKNLEENNYQKNGEQTDNRRDHGPTQSTRQ